ncbi:MAG: hypothetical protein WCQ50_10585 [Spirochaetota bacterium]
MKKLLAVAFFVALIAGGASAQLMFGATGDLHLGESDLNDAVNDPNVLLNQFQKGDGVYVGGFVELAFGNLGFGGSGTFSFPIDYFGNSWMVYDATGYVSYHLFGARFFLDPFVEVGGGYTASDYSDVNMQNGFPISATIFWYGSAGLGINLGGLGVFAKLAYVSALSTQLDGPTDLYGNPTKIPNYRDPLATNQLTATMLPPYKVTIGAKFIL